MGRGAGCGTAAAIEASGRWIAGTQCRRLAVKEGSYPGGGGGDHDGGERTARRGALGREALRKAFL